MTDDSFNTALPSSQDKAALTAIKYHSCPRCGEQAILVVDAETETHPYQDTLECRYYHCKSCTNVFSVGM